MFNSSKFHGNGSIVTCTYLYVRCGTFECPLETQYLNSNLKYFFPKEGWHSHAIWSSIQLLHMKYNNCQIRKIITFKKGYALAQRELLIWEPRTFLYQQRMRLPAMNQ